MHNRYQPSPHRPSALLAAMAACTITILTTVVPPDAGAQFPVEPGIALAPSRPLGRVSRFDLAQATVPTPPRAFAA